MARHPESSTRPVLASRPWPIEAPIHGRPPANALGELMVADGPLSGDDVAHVLRHQQLSGLPFGECAVALGLAKPEDVLAALTRQFRYPCALAGGPPPRAELVMLSDPFGERADRFRSLRGQLTLGVLGQGTPAALAVVSAESGDGRSFVSANLAVALAQLGSRTLLIDADLRRPRQQALFGLRPGPGLASVLAGRTPIQAVQAVDQVPGLWVLPAGALPPNPQELVEQPMFGQTIAALCSRYDQVVVDTPAADAGTDAVLIAARCQATLLVARQGATPLSALADLQRRLALAGSALAGVLLNRV